VQFVNDDVADVGHHHIKRVILYRFYRALEKGHSIRSQRRRARGVWINITGYDNARAQQSGVSIDEEMTNLVEFQHGYDAAARLLTTIDGMLDTLINHTGLV